MTQNLLDIFSRPAIAFGSILSSAATGTFAVLNAIETWIGICALIMAMVASFFTILAMYESWREKRHKRKNHTEL